SHRFSIAGLFTNSGLRAGARQRGRQEPLTLLRNRAVGTGPKTGAPLHKLRAFLAKRVVQQLTDGNRPPDYVVDFGALLFCHVSPTFRGRPAVDTIKKLFNFRYLEAHVLGKADDRQPFEDPPIVSALPADSLRLGQQSKFFVISD